MIKRFFIVGIFIIVLVFFIKTYNKKTKVDIELEGDIKTIAESLHQVERILNNKLVVVIKMKREDEELFNTYSKTLENLTDDGEKWLEIMVTFNKKRKEKVGIMKKSLGEIKQSLDSLFILYKDQGTAEQIIGVFRDYIYAYKIFVDSAYSDIKKKIFAGQVYKEIHLLEKNEQNFHDAIDMGNYKLAYKYLNTLKHLISSFKRDMVNIQQSGIISKASANVIIDTYKKIYSWDKRYYYAIINQDINELNKLLVEGADIFINIPREQSDNLVRRIQNILLEVPENIDSLLNQSMEKGKKAYALYFIVKIKIGENPDDLLGKDIRVIK